MSLVNLFVLDAVLCCDGGSGLELIPMQLKSVSVILGTCSTNKQGSREREVHYTRPGNKLEKSCVM